MDWETLKNLYIDIFTEPKVGWYDQGRNIRSLEIARERGINFLNHLVEKYNPHDVIDIHNRPYKGQYQKVNIPPRSQLANSGRRYVVAPRNIIPYSPDNKSLANVLLRKGIGVGSRALSKLSAPLMFIEGMGWNNEAR